MTSSFLSNVRLIMVIKNMKDVAHFACEIIFTRNWRSSTPVVQVHINMIILHGILYHILTLQHRQHHRCLDGFGYMAIPSKLI